MSSVVLDASAVTAVLRKEPGYENVIPRLRGSLISSVNLAEVTCLSQARGSSAEFDELAIRQMQITEVPFDRDLRRIVSFIYGKTLGGSVGFADRTCMALGLLKGLPVITGDREWLDYDVGVEVQLFRHG